MRSTFVAVDSASGVREAATLGKPWLWSAFAALALCGAACLTQGLNRGRLAATGAAIGPILGTPGCAGGLTYIDVRVPSAPVTG